MTLIQNVHSTSKSTGTAQKVNAGKFLMAVTVKDHGENKFSILLKLIYSVLADMQKSLSFWIYDPSKRVQPPGHFCRIVRRSSRT